MVKIYPTNTKVTINKDIDGIIKQVLIEGDNVSYKVGYWNGREYKSEWFTEAEFDTAIVQRKIGFINE